MSMMMSMEQKREDQVAKTNFEFKQEWVPLFSVASQADYNYCNGCIYLSSMFCGAYVCMHGVCVRSFVCLLCMPALRVKLKHQTFWNMCV